MTQNLENHGFLIFFISIMIVTQLRWAESYNYNDIAKRLAAAILIGIILNWLLKKFIGRILEKMETTNNLQRSINDISFTLSFSFFWVAFHENVQIAGGIVMLSVIYMIKINEKARNWISIFLKSKNFEVELDETKDLPIVIVKGNHEPNNLASFQYLCVDLSEIFFEIKPRKFREVQLELQITNTSVEKILPLIFSIAENHGIKLSYQKKII